MSGCRRLRHVMEPWAMRRDRALSGSKDSGIGAAETGIGSGEAGSVRRERVPFGFPTAGSRMATVTASSVAIGDGRAGALLRAGRGVEVTATYVRGPTVSLTA